MFPHIFNPRLFRDEGYCKPHVKIKLGASLHKMYFNPSPASGREDHTGAPAPFQMCCVAESLALKLSASVVLVVYSPHSSLTMRDENTSTV